MITTVLVTLRLTLSVRLSVCLSVCLSVHLCFIVYPDDLFDSSVHCVCVYVCVCVCAVTHLCCRPTEETTSSSHYYNTGIHTQTHTHLVVTVDLTRVVDANDISIATAAFAGLTRWQTDRPHYSVGNNRRSAQWRSQILLLSTATTTYNKYLLEQSTQIHNACLSFVSVHQMAPTVTEVGDIQLHLTTHLWTPKGWKAELVLLVDQ